MGRKWQPNLEIYGSPEAYKAPEPPVEKNKNIFKTAFFAIKDYFVNKIPRGVAGAKAIWHGANVIGTQRIVEELNKNGRFTYFTDPTTGLQYHYIKTDNPTLHGKTAPVDNGIGMYVYIPEMQKTQRQYIDQWQRDYMIKVQNDKESEELMKKYAQTGVQSFVWKFMQIAPQTIGSFGLGMLTGGVGLLPLGQALIASHTFMEEAGNVYWDLIDMGVSHERASSPSIGVGLVNAVVESYFVGDMVKLAQQPLDSALGKLLVDRMVEKGLTTGQLAGRLATKGFLTSAIINGMAEGAEEWVQGMVADVGKGVALQQTAGEVIRTLVKNQPQYFEEFFYAFLWGGVDAVMGIKGVKSEAWKKANELQQKIKDEAKARGANDKDADLIAQEAIRGACNQLNAIVQVMADVVSENREAFKKLITPEERKNMQDFLDTLTASTGGKHKANLKDVQDLLANNFKDILPRVDNIMKEMGEIAQKMAGNELAINAHLVNYEAIGRFLAQLYNAIGAENQKKFKSEYNKVAKNIKSVGETLLKIKKQVSPKHRALPQPEATKQETTGKQEEVKIGEVVVEQRKEKQKKPSVVIEGKGRVVGEETNIPEGEEKLFNEKQIKGKQFKGKQFNKEGFEKKAAKSVGEQKVEQATPVEVPEGVDVDSIIDGIDEIPIALKAMAKVASNSPDLNVFYKNMKPFFNSLGDKEKLAIVRALKRKKFGGSTKGLARFYYWVKDLVAKNLPQTPQKVAAEKQQPPVAPVEKTTPSKVEEKQAGKQAEKQVEKKAEATPIPAERPKGEVPPAGKQSTKQGQPVVKEENRTQEGIQKQQSEQIKREIEQKVKKEFPQKQEEEQTIKGAIKDEVPASAGLFNVGARDIGNILKWLIIDGAGFKYVKPSAQASIPTLTRHGVIATKEAMGNVLAVQRKIKKWYGLQVKNLLIELNEVSEAIEDVIMGDRDGFAFFPASGQCALSGKFTPLSQSYDIKNREPVISDFVAFIEKHRKVLEKNSLAIMMTKDENGYHIWVALDLDRQPTVPANVGEKAQEIAKKMIALWNDREALFNKIAGKFGIVLEFDEGAIPRIKRVERQDISDETFNKLVDKTYELIKLDRELYKEYVKAENVYIRTFRKRKALSRRAEIEENPKQYTGSLFSQYLLKIQDLLKGAWNTNKIEVALGNWYKALHEFYQAMKDDRIDADDKTAILNGYKIWYLKVAEAIKHSTGAYPKGFYRLMSLVGVDYKYLTGLSQNELQEYHKELMGTVFEWKPDMLKVVEKALNEKEGEVPSPEELALQPNRQLPPPRGDLTKTEKEIGKEVGGLAEIEEGAIAEEVARELEKEEEQEVVPQEKVEEKVPPAEQQPENFQHVENIPAEPVEEAEELAGILLPLLNKAKEYETFEAFLHDYSELVEKIYPEKMLDNVGEAIIRHFGEGEEGVRAFYEKAKEEGKEEKKVEEKPTEKAEETPPEAPKEEAQPEVKKETPQSQKKYTTPEEFIKALQPEQLLDFGVDREEKLRIFMSEKDIDNLVAGFEALKKARQDYLDKVKKRSVTKDMFIIQRNKEIVERAEEYLNEVVENKVLSTPVSQEELDKFLDELKTKYPTGVVDTKTFYKRLTQEQIDYLLDKLTNRGEYEPFLTKNDFKSKAEYRRYDIKTTAIRSLFNRMLGKYPQASDFDRILYKYYHEKYGVETSKAPKGAKVWFARPEEVMVVDEKDIPAKSFEDLPNKSNVVYEVDDNPDIFANRHMLLKGIPAELLKKMRAKYNIERQPSTILEYLEATGSLLPVEVVAYTRVGSAYIAHLYCGRKQSIDVNAEYYNWLKRNGYDLFVDSGDTTHTQPLIIKRNNKIVGVLNIYNHTLDLVETSEQEGNNFKLQLAGSDHYSINNEDNNFRIEEYVGGNKEYYNYAELHEIVDSVVEEMEKVIENRDEVQDAIDEVKTRIEALWRMMGLDDIEKEQPPAPPSKEGEEASQENKEEALTELQEVLEKHTKLLLVRQKMVKQLHGWQGRVIEEAFEKMKNVKDDQKPDYFKGVQELLANLSGVKAKNVEFDEILLSEKSINVLSKMVIHSSLQPLERLKAMVALTKVLREGTRILHKSEIDILVKALGLKGKEFYEELTNNWRETFGSVMARVFAIPKVLMASIDDSIPFRQGITMIGHPKMFFSGVLASIRAIGSERYFDTVMQYVYNHEYFDIAHKAGLAVDPADMPEEFFAITNEQIKQILTKAWKPIEMSQRGATAFLFKTRIDYFKYIYDMCQEFGMDMEDENNLRIIARYVNNMTGWGNTETLKQGVSDLLNAMLFSPRLIASRVTLLNPAMYLKLMYGDKGKYRALGKEAIRMMLRFIAFWLATVFGLKKLFGDKAYVELDPSSADFLKFRYGNFRLDASGGFTPYIKAIAQMFTYRTTSTSTFMPRFFGTEYGRGSQLDVLLNFLQGKEAPIFGLAIDILKGVNFAGEPMPKMRDLWKPIPNENLWGQFVSHPILSRLTPMFIQDIIEVAQNEPEMFPLAMVGFFGFGVQAYGTKVTEKYASYYDLLISRGVPRSEALKKVAFRRALDQYKVEVSYVRNAEGMSAKEKKRNLEVLKKRLDIAKKYLGGK